MVPKTNDPDGETGPAPARPARRLDKALGLDTLNHQPECAGLHGRSHPRPSGRLARVTNEPTDFLSIFPRALSPPFKRDPNRTLTPSGLKSAKKNIYF